jgi:hypothetical protein
VFRLVAGQPCSGEAAFDEAGLVLDLLQAVPDDLDQGLKLAAARLASTPRLSTDQMPSGSLTLGYRQSLMVM